MAAVDSSSQDQDTTPDAPPASTDLTGSAISNGGGEQAAGNPGAFQSTRWSLVARAVSKDDKVCRAALEEVCRDYWYPLYAFARRSGIRPADAEDLVQGFFLRLIEDGVLGTADPARGRLRSYLIRVFRNQAADEARRRSAMKRGGDCKFVSLDRDWAEERLAVESGNEEAEGERAHDRRWALLLLERTLETLTNERSDAGQAGEMRVLSHFLSFATGGQASYEVASTELGWTVNATRVAVFRLRRRFRDLLSAAIADTLEDPTKEAVEAEIRELMDALA